MNTDTMKLINTSELESGVRIATQAMPHIETFSLGVWFATGSRHEEAGENGLAHFLEHMVFKGTARRSAREIAEQVESVGGDINACTAQEFTGYYLKVLPENAEFAFDLLSDMLLSSRFDTKEIEREKGVVFQEIGMSEDSPDDVCYEALQAVAYAGHALARPVLGTRTSVGGLDASNLRAFIDRNYVPGSCVLGAAGKLEHARLVEFTQRYFGNLPAGAVKPVEPARFHPGERRIERDHEQAYLFLAFPAGNVHAPDFYATQVLAMVLGGSISSRLFQEVREKQGLCYSIGAFYSPYRDTGQFGIHASTEPANLTALVESVARELNSIRKGISEAELNRARAQYRVGLMSALESTGRRAEQIARHVHLFGRVIPPHETIALLDRLTPVQIAGVADELFDGRQMCLSAVGPVANLPSGDAIRSAIPGHGPRRLH